MAISRVEIKDFLVFKGEFAVDLCPGVNVLIGANGTGKTTLLREMYYETTGTEIKFNLNTVTNAVTRRHPCKVYVDNAPYEHNSFETGINCKYIPEKDIFENARGLLPFITQKPTSFDPNIYGTLLISGQDLPTNTQNETQKDIGEKIVSIIGGVMQWVESEGLYYTMRTDGARIPFTHEASGFKKLGYLGLLVASGQLEPETILFWDEPENSLNPKLIAILVDILLKLSKSGVQIFIATHSELLASYFDALREDDDELMFFSLYKNENNEQIELDTSDRFDLLTPNTLTAEQAKLYECEVERAFSNGKR